MELLDNILVLDYVNRFDATRMVASETLGVEALRTPFSCVARFGKALDC